MAEGNGTSPAGRDDGADRDTRPSKPCCKRVRAGELYGFCELADGHDVTRAATGEAPAVFATPCQTTKLSAAPPPTDYGAKYRRK